MKNPKFLKMAVADVKRRCAGLDLDESDIFERAHELVEEWEALAAGEAREDECLEHYAPAEHFSESRV